MIYYLGDNYFKTDEDQVLQMLYYDKIGLNEEIKVTKSINSEECMICHN